jgi:hypothetical protein
MPTRSRALYCGGEFTGACQVTNDGAPQHYAVNWHTKDFQPSNATVYRIRVIVLGQELGVADVKLGRNASELRNIDPNQFIAVVNGSTLPIKFRIERGAVGAPSA